MEERFVYKQIMLSFIDCSKPNQLKLAKQLKVGGAEARADIGILGSGEGGHGLLASDSPMGRKPCTMTIRRWPPLLHQTLN